jgi:hypothetical protein
VSPRGPCRPRAGRDHPGHRVHTCARCDMIWCSDWCSCRSHRQCIDQRALLTADLNRTRIDQPEAPGGGSGLEVCKPAGRCGQCGGEGRNLCFARCSPPPASHATRPCSMSTGGKLLLPQCSVTWCFDPGYIQGGRRRRPAVSASASIACMPERARIFLRWQETPRTGGPRLICRVSPSFLDRS